MVSLNFTRADLVEIIHIIAQHLRLTYTIDPEVKGTVTINSAEPLRPEDLLPIFHQILRMNGAVAVRTGNLYHITTLKDGKGLARPIGQGREDSYAMQVVPVRFLTVAEMKKVLQPFVMPGGELIDYARGNFLVIIDIPSNIQRLVEIADLIDVQIFAGTRMEIYQPKVASAEELAQEMTKVMQSFAASAPQADSFTAQFLPLPRINQLLVIAHSEAAWTYARRWLERIDVVAEGPGRRIFIYPVENGKAGDLADVLSQALGLAASGTRSQTPTLQSLHRSTTGGTNQQGSGVGNSSSSPFGGSNNPNQQRTTGSAFATIPIPGQPANPVAPSQTQPPVGIQQPGPGQPRPATPGQTSTAKPEEQLRIVADVGTNSLIIYGTAQEFQSIKTILKDLDIVPRQVLIDALILQVDLRDTDNFGVDYEILRQQTTIFGQGFRSLGALRGLGSLFGSPSANGAITNLGATAIVGDNTVQALIRALATDSRVKIISSPSVLATDNRPARIQVGSEEPIPTGTINNALGSTNGISSSTTIQYRNTGRILTIIPQVNSQGLVHLQLKAEVSSRGEPVRVGQDDFPAFNTQDAETTAVVQDGETLVIGGLIGERKSKGRSGLPYLMDLPFVGRFFGTTIDDNQRTELIMLITPRVIRNRDESRLVSDEFKSKLSTIRNELEKMRFDRERDLERLRRLRPQPPAPAAQMPPEEMPTEPVPPANQQTPTLPAPAVGPTSRQFQQAPTARQLPAKQTSAPAQPGLSPTNLAAAQQGPFHQMVSAATPTDASGTVVFPQTPIPENDSISTILNQLEANGLVQTNAPQGVSSAPVWVVQVASYDRESDAQSFANKLKGKGYQANVAATEIGGKTRYRVEVGQLTTRNEAVALQKDLRVAQRIEDSLVTSKLPAPTPANP
jgi:general secretion pathway protein D